MARKEDEAYCFDLLKEGLNSNNDLSVGARIWNIGVGLVGSVTVDPIIYTCNKLGIKDDNPGPDPGDPCDPRNF